MLARAVSPGELTLGTDLIGSSLLGTSASILPARGVTHRRGRYRDPESQAFIRRSRTTSRATATARTRAFLPDSGGGRTDLADPTSLQIRATLSDNGGGVHVNRHPQTAPAQMLLVP